jgi:plasmid stability protein
MTQIILEGLDPLILECLENRAQKHGHSLQAEVKSILKQVAELEIKSHLSPEKIIQLKSALMLQQIEHHDQKMGRSVQSPINISEDRKQELLRTKAKLDQLKQKISLGGLSISEAKAEGRRY